MTKGDASPVTPDLIGGPSSTVGSGCPIKSSMTGGASGMTVSGVELLYRDQYPAVHHMLQRRVGNPEDAADLAQEAFLRLMRYQDHSLESLRFLLFRVAMNLAASHLRQQATRPQVDLDEVELIAEDETPEAQLADNQRIECFIGAVQSLPERSRQMFVLRRLEGKGTREVADEVGLSTRMVEQHLTRAHALLRERVAARA